VAKTSVEKDLKKTGKSTVDKDLKKIVRLEKAARRTGREAVPFGLGVIFLALVVVFTAIFNSQLEHVAFVVAAGVVGGYMALNIGANDVANNVGPAVGSRALTMIGALAIAAIFEAGGALIAGGDVVSTISKGIINPDLIPDPDTFIWAMLAALLSAALWINLATYIGAPVSTTHAIVGGVMGSGVAAAGFSSVNWITMIKIAASWVISPVLGGVIAAAFLGFIKFAILFREDRIAAARRWVPLLIAIMAATFSMYLAMKGLKKVWHPPVWAIPAIGAAAFAIGFALVRPIVARKAATLENRRKAVSSLFTIPLICSAALLSFAHGANDVANAVGPLAAIVSSATGGGVATKVGLPGWVLLVGAIGISMGLVLYGPKLIRTVGEKITKLDQIRAFCVALSAAITVIVASALGLPVSSTHIAVGGVFGVGFFREFLVNRPNNRNAQKRALKAAHAMEAGNSKTIKKLEKAEKRRLVRRRHLMTIIAAWLVTVPLAALLAAALLIGVRLILAAA
jgi:PiT family inorganic phosphate transporter